MAEDLATQEITSPGVYPLGLVNIYFGTWEDQNTGQKSAYTSAHFDNGAQHLTNRFYFFDVSRWSDREGWSLGNVMQQLLFAGLAPEALYPLLSVYNEAIENQDSSDPDSLRQYVAEEVQKAEKNAREILTQKGLSFPRQLPQADDWSAYVNGGTVDGKEFAGYASMLVDKIYTVYTVETVTARGSRVTIPYKKDDLKGLPFAILPLWWGEGTGVQAFDPAWKFPVSRLTPEEWVQHSVELRAKLGGGRRTRRREIDQGGLDALAQMARLGLGGGGGGAPASPTAPVSSAAPESEDDVPF